MKINPEKIGALIGPGGKNIKKLVEESGCEINIEDDGTVNIYSVSEEGMKIAREAIVGMTRRSGNRQDLPRQSRHDQRFWRIRRVPARQRWPGPYQRAGQLPRQADRRYRQDGRRNLGQVPRRR